MLSSIIALLIIAAAVCAALIYIVKAKKKGAKCIGCSAAGTCCHCSHDSNQGCSCRRHSEER